MIFKNQARGTEDKRKKEFVNVSLSDPMEAYDQKVHHETNFFGQDLLRSDFHKRFMRFISLFLLPCIL